MITTTQSQTSRLQIRSGFTLVEVLISATLGAVLLAGVLTSFLFIGRSGQNLANYSDMQSQARKGMELFAQDVRQASAITWNSPTDITLSVDSSDIRYVFTQGTGTLTRQGVPLITSITHFVLTGYNITGAVAACSDPHDPASPDPAPQADVSTTSGRTLAGKITKQLQISLSAARNSVTVTTATNTVLSARYTLRNKRVTT